MLEIALVSFTERKVLLAFELDFGQGLLSGARLSVSSISQIRFSICAISINEKKGTLFTHVDGSIEAPKANKARVRKPTNESPVLTDFVVKAFQFNFGTL